MLSQFFKFIGRIVMTILNPNKIKAYPNKIKASPAPPQRVSPTPRRRLVASPPALVSPTTPPSTPALVSPITPPSTPAFIPGTCQWKIVRNLDGLGKKLITYPITNLHVTTTSLQCSPVVVVNATGTQGTLQYTVTTAEFKHVKDNLYHLRIDLYHPDISDITSITIGNIILNNDKIHIPRYRHYDAFASNNAKNSGSMQINGNPDAMFTGHFASMSVKTIKRDSSLEFLGFTQFYLMCNIFENAIGTENGGQHYGLNGQWIKDQAAAAGMPWGSLEGGLFASQKGGISSLPKMHVATSTHRYSQNSDTGGGWGFYERMLPKEYFAKVHLSNRVVLPPSGLSFVKRFDFKTHEYIGGGWVCLPIFDSSTRLLNQKSSTRLTWTFIAQASNFSGAICCYAPEVFTRRISNWKQFRSREDPRLKPEYLNVDEKRTLAYTSSNELSDNRLAIRPGGEFPNLQCVFSDGESSLWKVPQIALPNFQKQNIWASDFKIYTQENYNQFKNNGILNSKTLRPLTCSVSTSNIKMGVKSVISNGLPAKNGDEKDELLRLPFEIKTNNGSVVYEWNDGFYGNNARKISRYWKTGTEVADTIVNGNAETVQRRFCDPLDEKRVPEYMRNLEYHTTRVGPSEYGPHPHIKDDSQVYTLTLEDGGEVHYQWFKFRDQPAMKQLIKEFPNIYTRTEVDRIQKWVEQMQRYPSNDVLTYDKTKLHHLAMIEPSLIVNNQNKRIGYVPIAHALVYPNRTSLRSQRLSSIQW